MALYKGYSTHEYQRRKTLSLNDIELVKLDLLNHLFTSRGERVMMPNWGSIIPEIVFEPLDDQTIRIVNDDVRAVVNYDPRVKLLDMNMVPSYDEGRLEVHVLLEFLEFDIVDNMNLNIEFEG